MTSDLTRRGLPCLCFGLALAVTTPAVASDAPDGAYRCWQESTPIPSLNFILAGDTYTDSSGEAGKIHGSDTAITFVGAALDGLKAKYQKYAPPTFGLFGMRDEQLSTCQLTP